jgi:putative mRNA 3-end processing factor
MRLRGARRRRSVDRGFILSDHCDWPSLNQAIALTGTENVYVTHGYTAAYSRYVNENISGVFAAEVHTLYGSDEEAAEVPVEPLTA